MKIAMLHNQLSWITFVPSLLMLYLASDASAHSLRRAELLPAESVFQFEQATRQKVLASDLQFWGEMATGTESELHRVAEVVRGNKMGGKLLGLQLVNVLGSHQSVAPPNAVAELEPTAAMLDSFYEESKKRIVQLNQHEALSKQHYSEHQKEDRKRMAQIEAEFSGHQKQHMSAALQANDTALKNHLEDEENYFRKYWERVRARNHKQFHTCLKIQHDLMNRLKSMREAYQQAATQPAMATQPEVAAAALIQHQTFLQAALKEVATLHVDLSSWD